MKNAICLMVGSGPVHTQYTIFDSIHDILKGTSAYIYIYTIYIHAHAHTHICIYVHHESRNILYMNYNIYIYSSIEYEHGRCHSVLPWILRRKLSQLMHSHRGTPGFPGLLILVGSNGLQKYPLLAPGVFG
jgi:hypothetical protein